MRATIFGQHAFSRRYRCTVCHPLQFFTKKIKCPKEELLFSSVQLISLDYFLLCRGCSIESIIFLHPTNNYNFISREKCTNVSYVICSNVQSPIVKKVDKLIHCINVYQLDKFLSGVWITQLVSVIVCRLDSYLTSGLPHPTFEQPGTRRSQKPPCGCCREVT